MEQQPTRGLRCAGTYDLGSAREAGEGGRIHSPTRPSPLHLPPPAAPPWRQCTLVPESAPSCPPLPCVVQVLYPFVTSYMLQYTQPKYAAAHIYSRGCSRPADVQFQSGYLQDCFCCFPELGFFVWTSFHLSVVRFIGVCFVG
ncbi:hypothetical protein VPH35_089162 [Triticum aestivum]